MKRTVLAAGLLLAVLAACGPAAIPAPEAAYPRTAVEFVAPAGAGSGYDLTIRSVARCLEDTGLVRVPLPITNKAGGGGGVALEYLAEKAGADDVIAIYSPPLCLINLNGSTDLNYRDNTTPIARLITDYGCFVVGTDSPYHTIWDVMEKLKEDPASITIGGTSAAGSMDHVQFLQAAHAAGVPRLDEIRYLGFQDSAAVAQLIGGNVDLVTTGISDAVGLVESGDLRVLAITAEKRVGSGIVAEMPTCVEQGIDATFYNWRGLFGPKDMSPEALEFWEGVLEEMVKTPQWEEACTKYGWEMDYAGSREFGKFLEEMDAQYARLLGDGGLSPPAGS